MGALPGGEKTTWYDIAEFALKDVDPDKDGSRTLVYDGKESPERETAATEESSGFTEIPLLPLPEEAEEPKALTPSASAKRGDPEAIARGLAIHRLLELLPKGVPARNICADPKLAESAFRVLADPRVARFFGPGSLAEVPLVGMCDGRPVSGRIDRLAFAPDEALILDYKSARDVGDDGGRLSGKYLRQMDLYKRVLADIFPTRSVRAFVLFTETMQLVEC